MIVINSDKRLYTKAGTRFAVRGVTMFDYLFISLETRTDWRYRETGWAAPASGVSRPTYFARTAYVDGLAISRQIAAAAMSGVNLIRVGVEPAMQYSAAYVDPMDGKQYPSDMAMLDAIITTAGDYGVIVQLQNGNDRVPLDMNAQFLAYLAHRYAANTMVWINPANEINCANNSGHCQIASAWVEKIAHYVSTLRGAGWVNPIVINPPAWGYEMQAIVPYLKGTAILANDPCLIIGVHTYKLPQDGDFATTRLPDVMRAWGSYTSQFAVIVDEVGIDNFSGRHDPNLDPSVPSVDLVEWARMQTWARQFCAWIAGQTTTGTLNGATAFGWRAFIPGLSIHENNSMRRQDGAWTAWGEIYRKELLLKLRDAGL